MILEFFRKRDQAWNEAAAGEKSDGLDSPTNDEDKLLRQLEAFEATIDAFMNWLADRERFKERESFWQEELRKKEEMLQAKDSRIRELGDSLNAEIQLLSQLSEIEELLKSRDGELDALRSEVNVLTRRLAEKDPAVAIRKLGRL